MATTRLTRHIRAPRGVVYRALLDAEDVQQWMVPEGMTSQIHAFETDDRTMKGETTITYALADADDGTELILLYENLPPGVSPADNELGSRMSLDKLAKLVEGR